MATFNNGSTGNTLTVIAADLRREAQAEPLQVIGRRDPVVSLGVLGTRIGSLTVHCVSAAAARSFVNLHDGRTITVTAPDDPTLNGLKYVALSLTSTPWERLSTGWSWRVTVDLVEVT